ncbi:hypothetical protein ACFRAE_15615 [Sphingobacterium sp. HJSM2_6]|uniref:hypothetical protein n=1 Tax=Sphingobacterium sp. HJSM2_6 TaxID=3366264 RepID=UPI003BE61B59
MVDEKFLFDKDEYVLNYDQSISLLNIKDQKNVIWTVSNKPIGEISKNGKFIAKRIGTTTVKAKLGHETIQTKIIVEPYITSFSEPFTKFGVNKEHIKEVEKRNIIREGLSGIIYSGNGKILKEVYYIFYDKIYSSSLLIFNISQDKDMEEVITFYKERYTLSGMEEDVMLFENQQLDYLVALKKDAAYGYLAQYHPVKMPK